MRRVVAMVGAPFIGAVAAALVASACGGGGGAGSSGGSAGTVDVTVTSSGVTMSPANLSKTGTYTFHEVNNTSKQVSLDIEGNGVNEDATKHIGQGGSLDLQADLSQPGSYDVHTTLDGENRAGEAKGSIAVQG